MFGKEIVNSSYEVNKVAFRVLGIEPYPKNKVSKQYLEILAFPMGFLVAIAYRGTFIPNITLKGGVVRLTKVEVKGKVYKNPKAISEALNIKEAMYKYDLKNK